MPQTLPLPAIRVSAIVCIMLGSAASYGLAQPVRNLTRGTSFFTIQNAIDGAFPGDEIEVDPGTYFEKLDMGHVGIYLHGLDPFDADVVAATVINGGASGTVVRIQAGQISGFTITNGAVTGADAGGVHAMGTALVTNNVIQYNFADLKGGGVKVRDAAVLASNWIVNNTAGNVGGGVYANDDAVIINNCIAFNSANSGGGVYAGENTIVRNNTIVFNSASGQSGGGIVMSGSPVVLSNVVAFSLDGAGIHKLVGVGVTLDYNCVFGNVGGEYTDDVVNGPNDLIVDPMIDSVDFHLLPGSPCIDAGDPDLQPVDGEADVDGQARIANNRVDIGFDERHVWVSTKSNWATLSATD